MIRCLIFVALLLIHSASAKNGASGIAPKKWATLTGDQPAVVARGGFSGLFPASSDLANAVAHQFSIPEVVLLCNLHLTKDNVGLCLTDDIRIDNSTNIDQNYPKKETTYKVNGHDVTGYFALDYKVAQLDEVSLVQTTLSRPYSFDNVLPISAVEDVIDANKGTPIWINVQYDALYAEHKLNVASYLQRLPRTKVVSYISSPEIGFLKSMSAKLNKARTKLFFVFLAKDAIEPTTKQTYGKILEDLATIKPFVFGIIVPKDYIWPVKPDNYLVDAPTTVVADAHKQGLQVYASGFSNDFSLSYNYSFDPSAEYLQFLNNPQSTVDGFITDFPSTASAVVACFAQYNMTKPRKGEAMVISHNGASGVNAGSTDLAYQQAIDDGADIIDCSVQMTKDGVAFCLDTIDVTGDTTAMAAFMDRSTTVPELQQNAGIFSFDLEWSEIQTLQPQLISPFLAKAGLKRNPANKSKGKFLTLAEFLEFAKAKAVSGVLINIENAAYLATKGLDIVGVVSTALSNATFDKQSTQQVLIQSDDTSVLSKFQNVPAYKRVLYLEKEISEAPTKPVDEIKKYADAVTLPRYSIIPTTPDGFTKSATKVVEELHKANLSVYVSVLMNEYPSLAFDYLADPTVEIATYTGEIAVDGVITDYPATATRFLRNPCADPQTDTFVIGDIKPGDLGKSVPPGTGAPATAPRPPLDAADVLDPPLPAVAKVTPSSPDANATTPAAPSSAQDNVAYVGLSLLATTIISLLLMGY